MRTSNYTQGAFTVITEVKPGMMKKYFFTRPQAAEGFADLQQSAGKYASLGFEQAVNLRDPRAPLLASGGRRGR